jgi:putative transposase
MKQDFQHIGLAKLCAWFGITRQAYYQNSWKAIDTTIEEELVLQQVKSIRKNHPRLGTRKLYEKLQPFMLENNIKNRQRWLIQSIVIQSPIDKKKKAKNSNHQLISLAEKVS